MKSIIRFSRFVEHLLRGIALLIGFTLSAEAHDPGLSTLSVTAEDQSINVFVGFARLDAEFLLPGGVSKENIGTPEGFQGIRPVLQSALADGFLLYLGDERVTPQQTTARLKDSNNLEIHFRFTRSGQQQLRLLIPFLERLPFGHREFLSVQTTKGETLGQAMLSATKNSFQADLPSVSKSDFPRRDISSFYAFLKLGVEHILTGYDHLLFLFALMLVCRDLRSLLAVITCFTFAHSITLALASLDVIRLPGRIVEPLIAASIAYVGIENLFQGNSPKWRSLIAFAFGLIHGLGFADALRELGIGSGKFGIVLPLVGFNLGVEIGQLSVAAVVFPILWNLRRNPVFVSRWIPASSFAVAIAGSYWMLERVMQR